MRPDGATGSAPILQASETSDREAGGAAHAARPLRVLMVMHIKGSKDLGGARVQLEIADELRGAGCEVRVLAREEILGGRRGGRLGVSPDAFAAAAVRHVRRIASEYDVIDAHQGNLPVSKRRLGFDGLLVTRSVGLVHLYEDFARTARLRWPGSTGTLLARPHRRWRAWRMLRVTDVTFRHADVITVPNADERAYLDGGGLGGKTVVLGLGIEQCRLEELAEVPPVSSSAPPRIAFIGTWGARKGAHDWPGIVAGVRRRLPDASFVFLGTHVAAAELERRLGLPGGAVEVIPTYASAELGGLLRGVRVGALPSYVEGFGIGVLEKMAAGIPSVCYDVPGPRETMGRVDRSTLVLAGDTEAFAERLVELLGLDDRAYAELGARCRAVAAEFSWRVIAKQTLAVYRDGLAQLKRSPQGR
jgi:glycosyltransferase involved in cell wall biosynthesis